MSRKIIYLINPISGTRQKSSLTEMIRRKTSQRNIPFEILLTNANSEYGFLRKKIVKENITDVVIAGGDGTFSSIASALKDLDIQFGIIPMGSGNGLALSAKIPVTSQSALQVIFEGRECEIDGMMINDKFSCMLCGIGFDAQVAHDFALQKRRGLQTYIKVSLINYFKATPYRFIVNAGSKKIETEAFFLSIANSNQFGNNFTIAPQASLQDGLLDIVIVKKMSKFLLPFSVLGQVTGINAMIKAEEQLDHRNILYFQSDHLTIENPDGAPLHIDGDPAASARRYEIRIIPKAFRLILPFVEKAEGV
ncbi:MAG TPA: YegS/Rv2252/BmrU family lipid kinase [Flavitalea sp.]|nr:YegS/Rv2252/BmrU family lipid kinase [Flavitalea sp.]